MSEIGNEYQEFLEAVEEDLAKRGEHDNHFRDGGYEILIHSELLVAYLKLMLELDEAIIANVSLPSSLVARFHEFEELLR